jgi:GH35 family endo-1,4-beta-xylanase
MYNDIILRNKRINIKMRKSIIMKQQLTKILLLSLIAFSVKAQTLKSVIPTGKYLGTIMKNSLSQTDDIFKPLNQLTVGSDLYNQVNISRNHFNAMVMENGMKMDNILKNYNSSKFPNVTTADLNLTEAKRFVKYCNDYGMRARGHALLWYSQAPGWLNNLKPSKADIYTFMEQFIKAFAGAPGIKGQIKEWDVANEMLLSGTNQYGFRTKSDGNNPTLVWYGNIAGAGQENTVAYSTEIDNLLAKCFTWAHEADPEAKLFYNDYSVEDVNWQKAKADYDLVARLRGKGAPIDGVGFQAHLIAGNFINGGNIAPNLSANIKKFAGLKNASNQSILVSITELDLRNDGGNMSAQQIQDAYWNVVSKSLVEPNCNLVLIWGISDKDSWIQPTFNQTPYLLWNNSYAQNGTTTAIGGWKGVYDALKSVSSTLSNEEFDAYLTGISIYPNPAVDKLNIQGLNTDDGKINLYDVAGKNILANYTVSQGNATIDVSKLSLGVYVIKTYSGKSLRFIKQ